MPDLYRRPVKKLLIWHIFVCQVLMFGDADPPSNHGTCFDTDHIGQHN